MAKEKNNFSDYFNPKEWFTADNLLKNLVFILFIGALAIIYIWNRNNAEKDIIEMNRLQQELVEYHWEFTSRKSELNHRSKQSEVARLVESIHLKELTAPPFKIVVGKNEY